MAAHHHGQYLNASELGRSLGETHKTVQRHLEMLEAAFMVRLLRPGVPIRKRLVRRNSLVGGSDCSTLCSAFPIKRRC